MVPGEYFLLKTPIEINAGRTTAQIRVVNTGDRPVQIGSHFHFFEVYKMLEFDREKAFGMRLDIAAGTAVRFEPGEARDVQLVAFGGARKLVGFNALVNGDTTKDTQKKNAMEKVSRQHFKNKNA